MAAVAGPWPGRRRKTRPWQERSGCRRHQRSSRTDKPRAPITRCWPQSTRDIRRSPRRPDRACSAARASSRHTMPSRPCAPALRLDLQTQPCTGQRRSMREPPLGWPLKGNTARSSRGPPWPVSMPRPQRRSGLLRRFGPPLKRAIRSVRVKLRQDARHEFRRPTSLSPRRMSPLRSTRRRSTLSSLARCIRPRSTLRPLDQHRIQLPHRIAPRHSTKKKGRRRASPGPRDRMARPRPIRQISARISR